MESQKKRTVNTSKIREAVTRLIKETSFKLPADVEDKLREMAQTEDNPLGKRALDVIVENSAIAKDNNLPLCQDCGVVVVFLEIGQDVSLEGDPVEKAINDGVEEAYKKLYLRKSVVADPLNRKNTGTNTPAFIHTEIKEGDRLEICVYLKGGGSENMTFLKMFRPTDSVETIIDYIEDSVVNAGPNPCPPVFLGIGIGGTADVALLNSKKAVLRKIGTPHPDPYYSKLEKTIEKRINKTNVGPLGFGGQSTTGGVFIKEAPCHIASLPVAINMNCHSLRYMVEEI